MLEKKFRNKSVVLLLHPFSVQYKKTASRISSFVESKKQAYIAKFSQNSLSRRMGTLSIGYNTHHQALVSHHIELLFFYLEG